MAAKTTKSNKTDHVLNLLTGGGENTDKQDGAQEEKEESAQVNKQEGMDVPVVQSVNDEQEIAETIREALEEEAEQAEVEQVDAEQVDTEKVDTEQVDTKNVDIQEPVEEMGKADAEENFVFLNVMEHLVRDKVEGYMNQFGNCTCPRCIADTTALSLSKLPAKYVVISKEAVSPLLNFYESKYAGDITVEITKACISVKESPHHE